MLSEPTSRALGLRHNPELTACITRALATGTRTPEELEARYPGVLAGIGFDRERYDAHMARRRAAIVQREAGQARRLGAAVGDSAQAEPIDDRETLFQRALEMPRGGLRGFLAEHQIAPATFYRWRRQLSPEAS